MTLGCLMTCAILIISCTTEFDDSPRAKDYFHVKNGNYEIPVLVRGNTTSKRIILYVQGGPGYSSLDFAKVDFAGWKETLEKDFAVAYYDQRGTGNKQGNFSMGENALETWLDDLHAVAAFLKQAYNANVIMMGHSFGGSLVYRYMLSKKELGVPTQYITLNAPVTSDRVDDVLRWQFRREFLVNIAELEISRNQRVEQWQDVKSWLARTPVIHKTNSANPFELMDQWNKYVEDLVYVDYQEKIPRAKDYFNVIFFSNYNPMAHLVNSGYTWDTADRIAAEERKSPIADRLDEIGNHSLLILTGRYDDICPPEELTYAFDQITSQQKQMRVIDFAGHDSYTHQPAEFYRTIKQFIK